MKVVLFCGGQGMRLREYSEQIPKPNPSEQVLLNIKSKFKRCGVSTCLLLAQPENLIKRSLLNTPDRTFANTVERYFKSELLFNGFVVQYEPAMTEC